jgi:hypothetical protein
MMENLSGFWAGGSASEFVKKAERRRFSSTYPLGQDDES